MPHIPRDSRTAGSGPPPRVLAAAALLSLALAPGSPARAACPERLCVYSDTQDSGPWSGLGYGRDPGQANISALTPDTAATIGELIFKSPDPVLGVPVWDFSANDAGAIRAQTTVEINSSETCNVGKCGYNVPGGTISRDEPVQADHVTPPPGQYPQLAVFSWDTTKGWPVHWLRVGTEESGGPNESDICNYDPYPYVPQEEFPHADGARWYFTLGDSWSSQPFNCEQNVWGQGACYTGTRVYTGADPPDHDGTFSNEVVADGVIILPSGHHLDTLVIRNRADFQTYLFNLLGNCTGPVQDVRQFRYSFFVPYLSTVAILTSERYRPAAADPDGTLWTRTDSAGSFFLYGLLPPLSIAASSAGPGAVTVTWDPGDVPPGAIDRFRVYWDTDPGDASPYRCNSDDLSDAACAGASVAFSPANDGTARSATVSGLAAGATFHITVTALKSFPHRTPAKNPTLYESLLYPKQTGSRAGPVPALYPVEVTACAPVTEVAPPAGPGFLRVSKVVSPLYDPDSFALAWPAVTGEPCLSDYAILSSANGPDRFSSFSVLRGTAATTDTGPLPGSPLVSILVAARGPQGDLGPAGHCEETSTCP